MSGLLGSLHSARTGMTVSQASIQTTSHNINNMNTPGYSRQRVEQSAKSAYSNPGFNSSMGAGQLGTGAEATDIIRIRNTFYDFQYRSESHNYGETSIEYDYYKSMEDIFNEPSNNSISYFLNDFFNGWHELSKDPEGVGSKNVVVENAKYLINNINKVYEKLDQLQTSIKKQQKDMLKDVNSMLSNLEDLDKNIKIVEGTGKTPNDLLDQRDKILDELSFKMDLNDPGVQVAIKSKDINTGEYLTMEELNSTKIQDKDGKEFNINISGEFSGTLKIDKELDKYKKKIESLANGIVDSVNKIYKDTNDDGILSEEEKKNDGLFYIDEFDLGNNKKIIKIKLNEDIKNNPSKLEMNTDKALNMYNLKNKKIDFKDNLDLGDVTINNFYNNMVQELGQSAKAVIRDEKNQSKLLLSIDSSRLSVSGVSMDEEIVNLIQFQHAYNASAKVVSTIDSLLDVVINGLVR